MIEILITYFLISVLASAIFYILGGIIFNLLKLQFDNPYLKIFAHLFCGMIAAVFIYSIIITHGNTIMTGLLIPFCFIMSCINNQKQKRERLIETLFINGKIILLCIIVLLLACGYNIYFLWDADNHILVPPSPDKVFYARTSDYLNYRGIESCYLDFFNLNNPRPYHYFELWITALIIRFPGLNTVLVQQISLSGIFFLTIYFGGLALVNSVKKVTFIDIVICLILPVFEGVRFYFLPVSWFHHRDWFYFDNPFMRQKYCEVTILFLASGLLFLRQRKDLALLVLLFSVIINISQIMSLPFVIIIYLLFIKTGNKIKVFFCSVLTILFCVAFYFANRTTGMMKDNPSFIYMIKYTFSSFSVFKIAFDNTAKSILEFFIIFIPFLFALFIVWKRSRFKNTVKTMTLFVIITVILSATLWSVFEIKSDSMQLFTNTAIPIVSTFFFIIVILFISTLNSTKASIVYSAFVVWGFMCVKDTHLNLQDDKTKSIIEYSPEYLQTVKTNLLKLNNQGGTITKFKNIYDCYTAKFFVFSYKPYMAMIKNNINLTFLQSTDTIPLWQDSVYLAQEKEFAKMCYFDCYLENQKANNKYKTESQSRMDYIKENKLEFIIADKNAVVDSLLQLITDTIITDNKSGERFMILKK